MGCGLVWLGHRPTPKGVDGGAPGGGGGITEAAVVCAVAGGGGTSLESADVTGGPGILVAGDGAPAVEDEEPPVVGPWFAAVDGDPAAEDEEAPEVTVRAAGGRDGSESHLAVTSSSEKVHWHLLHRPFQAEYIAGKSKDCLNSSSHLFSKTSSTVDGPVDGAAVGAG